MVIIVFLWEPNFLNLHSVLTTIGVDDFVWTLSWLTVVLLLRLSSNVVNEIDKVNNPEPEMGISKLEYPHL